jgi:hypothetical protein
MTYVLEREDVRRIVHAQGLLARAFFAGGADVVRPGLRRFEELRDLSDVERLEREGPDVVRARDLDLSAYHPLGTCQMGPDAKRSVIGPTQECWDVPGLFVCDGSAVPGPLGVNPQLTIMALSERAADFVAARVDRGSRSRSVEPAGAHLRFAETMRGTMELASGETIEVSFSVEARGAGGTFALAGTIDAPGIASGSRCLGTLAMRPDRREGTLVYDLDFEGDDGAAYTLHGEKHTRSARRLWRGMTTLHSELRADGALVARGALTFDRAQLPTFLASFGWRPAAA